VKKILSLLNINIKTPESVDEIIKNVMGPTSKQMGGDLSKVYEYGRNNIFRKAWGKIDNPKDGMISNLRVARDVIWNGSYSEDDVTAEYFGGILASSRSKDGKNDSGIFYLDIIKSLSSDQLKTHYIVYRILNLLFLKDPSKRNLFMGNNAELSLHKIYIPHLELVPTAEENLARIMFGLRSKDLVDNFKTRMIKTKDGKRYPILEINPTTLGVQLFCIGNNKLDSWLDFASITFDNWPAVELPQYFSNNKEDIIKQLGISSKDIIKEP
jgi:hypothetical protein